MSTKLSDFTSLSPWEDKKGEAGLVTYHGLVTITMPHIPRLSLLSGLEYQTNTRHRHTVELGSLLSATFFLQWMIFLFYCINLPEF